MSAFAWVTLATNDSYSLGALVLAHSLKRANTAHQMAILITPGVSEAMRTQLSAVYNIVQVVDVLDSRDETNLTLLARPELGITFTKLHCWRLTQFSKCVFLDADTLHNPNGGAMEINYYAQIQQHGNFDQNRPINNEDMILVLRGETPLELNIFKHLSQYTSTDLSWIQRYHDQSVLQNCDELFEREELSAAPDAGWPDCFNSGVFVFKPSNDTFKKLMEFAVIHGSFDGGDQGLLNLYYKDWSTKDISKHLPFVYNMCSTATYSYLPAFKQFGENLKIIHFIGSAKPWLQVFDTETGLARVSGESHSICSFIQLWWDLFCSHVHTSLSTEMDSEELLVQRPGSLTIQTRHRLSSCYVYTSSTTSTSTQYPNPSFSPPPRSNSRIRSPPPHVEPINSYDNTPYVFIDPWDELLTENNSDNFSQLNYDTYSNYSEIYHNESNNQIDNHSVHSFHSHNIHINNYHTDNNYTHDYQSNNNYVNSNHDRNPETYSTQHSHVERNNDPPHHEPAVVIWQGNESHDSNLSGGGNNELWNRPTKRDSFLQPERRISVPSIAEASPSQNQHACPSISAPTSPLPSPSSLVLHQEMEAIYAKSEPDPDPDGGLAGALASITLGSPLSPEQTALQEHLRRQGWEQGSIDYMGRDSFDNIWRKISETLNVAESSENLTLKTEELPPVSELPVSSTQSFIPIVCELPPKALSSVEPKLQTPPATPPVPSPVILPAASAPAIPSASTPTPPPVNDSPSFPVSAPITPPVAAPPSPPAIASSMGVPTTRPVTAPPTPPSVAPVTPPATTPVNPPVKILSSTPISSPTLPSLPNVASQYAPEPPKSKPAPLLPAAKPERSLTKITSSPQSPISPLPQKPSQPSPLTPPSSPKTEMPISKSIQPSTPTVTSPTPPTSPPVDPFDPTLSTKLKVDPETPGTPPAGGQPSTPTGSTDEPPVPPKRKGSKSVQEQQASKPQPKGGKPGKGKK